jgi:quinol monooxygenase YgiN
MIDRALFVRIEAKEGKGDEVEDFLRRALDDVMEEEGTVDWYAVKFGARDFAIFDTFGSEKDRLAHLAGKVGRALIAGTPTLLNGVPKIEHGEVLAFKEAMSEVL